MLQQVFSLGISICIGVVVVGTTLRSASAGENKESPAVSSPSQQNSAIAPLDAVPIDALELQALETYKQLIAKAQRQKRLLAPTDERVQRAQAILDKLIPYTFRWNERVKNWQWEVQVVQRACADVYCLPGGKILMNSGIFNQFQLNDHEMAVLLAHEIAHALRGHASEFANLQPAIPYTREDEAEADVIGNDIAARAGYDPRAAISLWERLAAIDRAKPLKYAKIHPFIERRIREIKIRISDLLPLYAKALGKTGETLEPYKASAIKVKSRPQR
ncbi:Peptidase family M48 [Mycoavidus cysteinexigens]|uniref:Peptidase family M48 n=1 Tax=Mycoavidus cysteinexigens TaxID=1553431 RepID=A0A2Z6EYA7_9BURK|nr:M48 family metallopeptidase [Mycoavidus cysteinexigens]BBE10431.1 Peptidase family M48 [Mycoavidus cysteinexigens]GAM53194.1 zn-dependent protease with chaperone function PA4632 [bacterium endosymbiont of Mortierella elongata FMR23-6]GLR01793.1 hypothetical protein GCM10007934_16050 [Mycoavidus cysteinexigens]